MEERILTWEEQCGLSEPQAKLLKSVLEYPYTLLGGCSGGGKSRALVACAAQLNMLYASHHLVIQGRLAAGTMKDAYDRLAPHIYDLLVDPGYGELVGTPGSGRVEFKFYNKMYGTIKLESLYDYHRIRGRNIPYIGVDELSECPEECFQYLISRLRFAGVGNNPLNHSPFFATSNPDGDHAFWLKEVFVDKTFDTELSRNMKPYAHKFNYLYSLLEHNPNEEFVKSYEEDLDLLGPILKAQLKYGDWSYSVRNRFPFDIQTYNHPLHKEWNLIVGMDYGFSRDPAAAIFMFFDTQGTVWVDSELIFKGVEIDGAAKLVHEHIEDYYPHARNAVCYLDESCWQKDGKSKTQLPNHLRNEGIVCVKATNNHRVTNTLIEQSIKQGEIYFHAENTKQLQKAIKAIRFGKSNNPETLMPHHFTDPVYGLGYGLLAQAKASTAETREELRRDREYARQINKHMRKRRR